MGAIFPNMISSGPPRMLEKHVGWLKSLAQFLGYSELEAYIQEYKDCRTSSDPKPWAPNTTKRAKVITRSW